MLYSLAIIRLAVDLSISYIARLLPIQRTHTDTASQTGGMPRTAAHLQEKPIRYGFSTRRAGTQLSLK